MIEKKLVALLESRFEEEDLRDCYVVEVLAKKGQKVEVFVDSDGALTLDKCRIISRYLENHIEEKGWLGEKYTLDVSSPGIDRPITLLRQYRKNLGRKIRVKVHSEEGEKRVEGILHKVDEENIAVIEKRKKEEIVHHVDFDQIIEAKILISFK
ncbi:MAG: ribosome maturation factor [Bacteroidota bacterium]